MNDLEFIKNFSKITITKICKKANVSSGNLYANKLSKDKVSLVKRLLESELAKLYIIKDDINE